MIGYLIGWYLIGVISIIVLIYTDWIHGEDITRKTVLDAFLYGAFGIIGLIIAIVILADLEERTKTFLKESRKFNLNKVILKGKK